MINAVLVSHSPHLAGAEQMLFNLALMLQRTSEIEPVILIPGEGEFSRKAVACGLHYELIPPLSWYILPSDLAPYQRNVCQMAESLRKSLAGWSADVVVANTLTSVPAMLAAVELNLPSVVWVHGITDSFLMGCQEPAWTPVHDRFLLQCASRVIACSHWTSKYFTQLLRQDQVKVVPNWTHVDPAFTVSQDKYTSRRFACLNTFNNIKGHSILLDAVALLRRRGVVLNLDLFGAGNLQSAMEDRTAALGLGQWVHFRGRTTDMAELYDHEMCLINPSHIEPFGMTLIEAMARKTPVIATRSGGPEEIIEDGVTGYLVDRGDAAALADRMEKLLQSPDLAQQMGERGFLRARESFSEETAGPTFLPLLQEAVDAFTGYEQHVQTMVDLYRLFAENTATLVSTATNTTYYLEQCDCEPPDMAGHQLWNGPEIGRHGTRYPLRCEHGHLNGLQWCVSASAISPGDTLRLSIISESSGVIVRQVDVGLSDSAGLKWVKAQFPPIANSAKCDFTVLATAEIANGRCVFFEPWPQDMPRYRQMVARIQKKLGRWFGITLSRRFSPFFPLYGPKR